jgi:hypothetical protein
MVLRENRIPLKLWELAIWVLYLLVLSAVEVHIFGEISCFPAQAFAFHKMLQLWQTRTKNSKSAPCAMRHTL